MTYIQIAALIILSLWFLIGIIPFSVYIANEEEYDQQILIKIFLCLGPIGFALMSILILFFYLPIILKEKWFNKLDQIQLQLSELTYSFGSRQKMEIIMEQHRKQREKFPKLSVLLLIVMVVIAFSAGYATAV